MQITIEYESSWRNSFLDGSNNEELPKNGRNFIASMTALKQEGNFKIHHITKDTVMGVLNRLIGDQRKLYQARQDQKYYFKEIEKNFTDSDIVDKAIVDQELVFLRNVSGSTDQNSFTGMIKAKDKAFNSTFSQKLWGVIFLSLDDVIQFILDEKFEMNENAPTTLDPLLVIDQLESLNALKPISLSDDYQKAYEFIQDNFDDVDFKLTAKGLFTPISFYTSALYLQIEKLKKDYDLSQVLTSKGGLSGISKRGFTKKDFMDRYTTGKKKLIWGNPYILKEKRKGEGEVVQTLTKASGKLIINLKISREQAEDLEQKILDAGVSSFYLGKKGLAYVSNIRV